MADSVLKITTVSCHRPSFLYAAVMLATLLSTARIMPHSIRRVGFVAGICRQPWRRQRLGKRGCDHSFVGRCVTMGPGMRCAAIKCHTHLDDVAGRDLHRRVIGLVREVGESRAARVLRVDPLQPADGVGRDDLREVVAGLVRDGRDVVAEVQAWSDLVREVVVEGVICAAAASEASKEDAKGAAALTEAVEVAEAAAGGRAAPRRHAEIPAGAAQLRYSTAGVTGGWGGGDHLP